MAGIVYDLRNAWLPLLALAGSSAGQDAGTDRSAPDDSPLPADDISEVPTEEELRNPRLKKLSDEAARYRMTAKAEKERADAAEARANQATQTMRALALRTAFNEAARKAAIDDVEAAWRLAAEDVKMLSVGEDGTVDADLLHDVVRTVTNRHPGVLDATKQSDPDNLLPSGRRTRGKRGSMEGATIAALHKKFPALRQK